MEPGNHVDHYELNCPRCGGLLDFYGELDPGDSLTCSLCQGQFEVTAQELYDALVLETDDAPDTDGEALPMGRIPEEEELLEEESKLYDEMGDDAYDEEDEDEEDDGLPIDCPYCGAALLVDVDCQAGEEIECFSCGKVFLAPPDIRCAGCPERPTCPCVGKEEVDERCEACEHYMPEDDEDEEDEETSPDLICPYCAAPLTLLGDEAEEGDDVICAECGQVFRIPDEFFHRG